MASICVRDGDIQEANLKCNNSREQQVYQITNEGDATRSTRSRARSHRGSRITSRNVKPLFLLLRMNIPFAYVILFTLLYSCSNVMGYSEQRFAIEPQDQVAVMGSRVTLPCRVENKAGQLQWTKDDFGLGTHRHLVGYDRYKMVGSDEEGDYSLDIREVTLDDDAQYQCQVSSGPNGEPGIRSRYARLSVLVAPDPPKILQGSFIEVIEDSEQVFECVSTGGKPPAEITWVDGEGGVLNQNVIYTVQPMTDGRRFTARSTLRLRPRRYHDKQNLVCQAQNTADRAYKSATMKLEVKYAPAVRLFLKSNIAGGRIFEGDKLRLGCEAEGNPRNFTFKWYLNNQMIPGNYSNELIITNLTREHNDNTVKCEVHNAVGKSADSKILEVAYGPKFIRKPQNVEGETGTTATLSCTVDGHPTPEITWLHYENGKIIKVGQSSDLTVTVDSQTAGEYWCRADVDGFSPIEAAATVFVKGPPKILSDPTQYEIEDGTIRVVCLAFSVPRPDHFLWTFDGKELKPSGQDYEFLEEALSEGLTKSTLMIREGRSIHFGTYNCTVQNPYGSDTFEIRLVPYKIPHYLLVILVPGVGIVGVVSIIVSFILCRLRRRRRSMSDDDVKKPDVTKVGKGDCGEICNSDRSSNISELKLELRQIEGGYDAQSPNRSSCEYPAAAGLELPLAGLVPLPNAGLNENYTKYARYSTDFSDSTNNLHFKVSNQVNGYVQYVDYSKDYLPPPVLNSDLSQSLIRSLDANKPYSEMRSNHKLIPSNSNQTISALGTQDIGPDVIPFTSGDLCEGIDLSYAATYGNPYLKNNDPNTVYTNSIKADSSSAPPPPYYSLRNSILPSAVATSLPSSACLSRTHGSMAVPNNISAQTQVLKGSPQSPSALYILPPPNRSSQTNQITKCISTSGTHV